MNTRSYLLLLVTMLMAFSFSYASSNGSIWGYGGEGGIAVGDNAGADEDMSPNIRGYLQLGIMNQLLTRFGISYVPIEAKNVYSTQLVVGDVRFLFRPIQSKYLAPFLYAGVGAAKDTQSGSSTFIPVVPFGVGFQSQLSPKVALEVSGGYTLAISDELDDRVRANDDLSRISNKKHDGFFGLTMGLLFTNPYKKDAPAPVVVAVVPVKAPTIDPYTLDSDNDGINDGEEIDKYKTDPRKADTDGDGLSDYDEIFIHRTNPLKIDTDGGGMNDGAEIKAGKNPLDPKDDMVNMNEPKKPEPVVAPPKPDTSKLDTDGDGLTDIDEIQKYKTDPNKWDTDGDGLSDGDEVLKHRTNPLVADTDKDGLSDGLEINQYGTDPLKADTDGDGLSDYAEVMTHRTNPLKIDTDGGGMNDGAEIQAGKNPLDPKDDLLDMSKGKKVVLEGIVFASGKATIMNESQTILTKVFESLQANPDVTVIIAGHTDSVGGEDSNRSLSLRRAQAVKDWLVAKGVNSARIKVVGKGEGEPIATNDTSEGRAKNRRIEFEVEK